MRVAFPTNNNKTIASHIGLAKGFLIIDTESNEHFYLENPVLKKVKGENIDLKNSREGERGLGTGRIIPPLLAESGVNILVSHEFGEGMIRNLKFEGIQPFETDEKEIEKVLNELKNFTPQYTKSNFRRENFYGRGMMRGQGRGFGRGRGRRF